MPDVRVRVPASTTNLGPGFDCLGIALSLANDLALSCEGIRKGGCPPHVEVRVKGVGARELPFGEDNLVWRAAERVFAEAGCAPQNVLLDCINRVPLSSGLGSSAAACVGGMVAANELCGRALPASRLLELAAEMEGHADNVAAALLGGLTVAWDAKGMPRALRVLMRAKLRIVVCTPELQLATAKARAVLPESVPHRDAALAVGRAAAIVAMLATGDAGGLGDAMEDTLHQPYRAPLMPGMEQALAEARSQGALAAAVSGAGPSLVAFVPADAPGVAENVARGLERCFRQKGTAAESRVLRVARRGARTLKVGNDE